MEAAQFPVIKQPVPISQIPPPPPTEIPRTPSSPVVNLQIPDSKDIITPPLVAKPSKSSSPSTSNHNVISIPSYSRWFSWDKIHETETRFLPEFFDGKSTTKNPSVYKYYRDTMIQKFREKPMNKITYTEIRKMLVGDVGSIRRVFDFLEGWGLINYTGMVPMRSKEEKGSSSTGSVKSNEGVISVSPYQPSPLSSSTKETAKKFCSGCKTVCSIACFVCDKHDLTLCARCYVRGNYRVGVSATEFRRVEIREATKTGDWTEKDTLHLLEAIQHFGDDWKKVAEHVGGRSEKECVACFIKLPFKEQFVGPPDSAEVDKYYDTKDQSETEAGAENVSSSSPAKKRCLTPLADASNPIMAQVAFLSAMAGSGVAEAAARAAVAALSEEDLLIGHKGIREGCGSLPAETGVVSGATNDGNSTLSKLEESVSCAPDNDNSTLSKLEEAVPGAADNSTLSKLEEAVGEAQVSLKKEEQNPEKSISDIVEVQMKEIQEKIVHFEEMELHMEKEWHQLQDMKNQFFADQLAFLYHSKTPSNKNASIEKGSVNTTDIVT
ncbi:SWI/SNF complex subunit SWI3B-like [Papaver somniferum]|uniref:SWI/SNF complex subunit SWI3B-like n=1 Tax=Papaver somniferum TaxID=3469 RepID=UPI000E7037C4|nr:SWI/SNF complex subunit SWI3B-like [Papaver somniferum]